MSWTAVSKISLVKFLDVIKIILKNQQGNKFWKNFFDEKVLLNPGLEA
jgi:hypothetical protein